MTKPSLAKDFHRLLKKIGRLTDGQASIENVDWDNGNLNSFNLVIRPNASFYKGGRFKFSVQIPDNFTSEETDVPGIWCETDIYHPNIDRHEGKTCRLASNVCLNIFSEGTWHHSYGLEGVVLGILFLMHNPNISDPLSPEFDSGDLDIQEFAENVKDYMAGKEVEGNTYSIDFRVIDGEFQDLTLIENNAEVNRDNCGGLKINSKEPNVTENEVVSEGNGNLKYESNKANVGVEVAEKVHDEDTANNTFAVDTDTDAINKENEAIADSDTDDVNDVLPIKFVVDDESDDFFVIAFGDDEDMTKTIDSDCDKTGPDNNHENVECDKHNFNYDRNKLECDTDNYAESSTNMVSRRVADVDITEDKDITENCAKSNPVMDSTDPNDNGASSKSRRASLQNESQARTSTRFKTSSMSDDMNIKALLCVALDCLLTVYRNTL